MPKPIVNGRLVYWFGVWLINPVSCRIGQPDTKTNKLNAKADWLEIHIVGAAERKCEI